jgi:hypothetical protein
MKYKSYREFFLVIAGLVTACSHSDWERQQMSSDSPVFYVAKNDDGDGFVVRERLFIATTDKLASILDSGISYPFDLYLSGDGYVTKYKGKTPAWYNPHGILLVSDLERLFSSNPELRRDFCNSIEITLVLRDNAGKDEILRYKVSSKGSDSFVQEID